MYANSQEEYEADLNAQGENEAQQAAGYDEYLHQLIRDEYYFIYAMEVATDLLHSTKFEKSGLKAVKFLEQQKNLFIEAMAAPKKDYTPSANLDDDLPF